MPDSTDVDWGNIISIVLSLVAILFTFDAISSEKEHGTLRLTLSNSISRGAVLVSKFLAALLTISIPLSDCGVTQSLSALHFRKYFVRSE